MTGLAGMSLQLYSSPGGVYAESVGCNELF